MELKKNFSDRALEDFALLDRAVAGDERAYAELMNAYRKAVYHTMLKMVRNNDDAEDLTIEAFAKAFKSLPRFKKDFTFSTWLFRIATNNCIDFIRRRRLETMSIDSAIPSEDGDDMRIDLKDHSPDPQEAAIRTQKIAFVQQFVELLPPKYQTLVRLRYFDELSYEEIAAEIDAPLGTVKAQLHRARELLYDLVKNTKGHI